MPIVPFRGVGSAGVNTDQQPFEVNPASWSYAKNIRFSDKGLSPFSAYKHLTPSYTYSKTPVGVVPGGGGFDGYLVTVFEDGSMEQWNNGTTSDVTPLSGIRTTGDDQITVCELGGITYVNKPTDQPVYRETPFVANFALLPGWDANDRCLALRSFKDFLIAINVTKTGVTYGGMVKWSNAAQVGAPPADWDVTDDASLAGENVINDLSGDLLDGHALGNAFIVYGETQTFRMDYIGGTFIFRTDKLFDDRGILAPNCAIEIDNRHYVFGDSDIYVHDGVINQSIANRRIKETLYNEIDYENKALCRVLYDEVKSEVWFCYPSLASDSSWPLGEAPGCNKAAVYNHVTDTWTFIDTPGVVGATQLTLFDTATFDDFTTETYEEAFQTYSSFEGSSPKSLCIVSGGNTSRSVDPQPYFVDDLINGRQPTSVATDVLFDGIAEALNRDMDELEVPLYGRKQINTVYPQVRSIDSDDYMIFEFGKASNPNGGITWTPPRNFFPYADEKMDPRINGRYLSMRVTIPAGKYVELVGYDLDIEQISGR